MRNRWTMRTRRGIAAATAILLAIACATQAIARVAATQPVTARETFAFDAGWLLHVGDDDALKLADDDASWRPVTLPHAWNEDSAFKVSIEQLPTGVAWYRKSFALAAGDAGKKIFLEFEGIRHGAEVFVNGSSLGLTENGVMASGFDLTDHLKPAPALNRIDVRTDNRWDYHERATNSPYQWSDRNFYANYGGINKHVLLHTADRLYQTLPLYSNLGTTGVYVYASDFDVPGHVATIHAESQVRNERDVPATFAYDVVVRDVADGREVIHFAAAQPTTLAPGATATVAADGRASGLKFWSWGYGALYDVTTTLSVDGRAIDAVRTRTGFRKTAFAGGALALNDHVVQVHGYAQRTTNEWPALGVNVPAWLSDFSNRMMVDGNANLVRWMHVTPSKQDVESCDRVGLMQSMPAGDSEKDPTGRRWPQRVELMRDAIVYNRNDPSIVFYEGGNAGISEAHMAELVALRDQYDPHGGRAIGARDMLDSKVAEYGGNMLYVNKSAAKPLWAMEFNRDEAMRKYWDALSPPFHVDGDGPQHNGQDARVYNRNQDTFAIQDVRTWFDYYDQRPGTGGRVNAGGVNIVFSDSNTHHRGAESYRRSGEVDAMRLPKDAYFADRVMWDGWVDVERPRAFILGHWNYARGATKDVVVVSSAETVELKLNGRSLGFGAQSDRFLFTFKNVAWQPGTLEAIGYDAGGTRVCADSRRTAGVATALRLTPIVDPAGFRADAANVALVDVEVVDADGNRCPTALDAVTFRLAGPAEWRGGIAQATDNGILATTLPVECGVNRVIVRSTTTPGTITLDATANGLKASSVTLQTTPVAIVDGRSTQLPGDDLPSNLSRGPTPPPTPLVATRRLVKPDHVVAGANQADVAKLNDDDETTAWSSGGKPGTAWVRLDFDAPTTVDQLVMRLASWRTRGYPLRVTTDAGAVVFNDTAPPTVGYSTLRFAPVTCRSLRIDLAGESKESGTDLVEVTGKTDANGATTAPARGTLAIHELEAFGPTTRPAATPRVTPRG